MISLMQDAVEFCLLIQSTSLCLLLGYLRPLTLRFITKMCWLLSSITVFLCWWLSCFISLLFVCVFLSSDLAWYFPFTWDFSFIDFCHLCLGFPSIFWMLVYYSLSLELIFIMKCFYFSTVYKASFPRDVNLSWNFLLKTKYFPRSGLQGLCLEVCCILNGFTFINVCLFSSDCF